MTDVALVTVTHNSANELEHLLASVDRHLAGSRVVVVDSDSSDRSVEVAREWPGGAEVIELGRNAGFGAGVNAGIAALSADAPVTVVLNPDVELLDDSLAHLARELVRDGTPDRILAPLILLPDGRRQDSAHHEPGAGPLLLGALVPPAALPGPVRRRVDPWRADSPRRVGWAVGACLVARTDTLRRLGPFDDGAFLYAEDLDLGLRARDTGIETWFRPDAKVRHAHAHATSKHFGGEAFELLAKRRREVVEERRGKQRRRLDDWIQLITFADRIALKTLAGRPTDRERRQLHALWQLRTRD
jgi:N-acetylglucosaminyl-diphospho-decaprenol L-rhamnosyltransferase